MTIGWDSRGALLNYYQANLRALERGVQVTRIFVINKEDMINKEVQKVLRSQLNDGVEVRIAYREELITASDSSGRDTDSSFDFAIYDNNVITEVYSHPGKFFGRKTREPALIRNYKRLFELIEHSSHTTVLEEDHVILAADVHLVPRNNSQLNLIMST
jgi:ketosteroid isomerase-like protein